MHAAIKNKNLLARPILPGTAQKGAAVPDPILSAAFRAVLGGRPHEGHLPHPALKAGQEIARHVRTPGAPQKGVQGKTRIGPRSGHK